VRSAQHTTSLQHKTPSRVTGRLDLCVTTMVFSETPSLWIRGYKESDLDHLVLLHSSPNKQRSDPVGVVPKSEAALRTRLATSHETTRLYAVLEAKQPLADGHNWVGFVCLWEDSDPKNRALMFGIALDPRHWGKGYGTFVFSCGKARAQCELAAATEATRWIVDYAFTQFGTHRIALQVMGDNFRAIAVYKKVYVCRLLSRGSHSYSVNTADLSKKEDLGKLTTRTESGGTSCICRSSPASGSLTDWSGHVRNAIDSKNTPFFGARDSCAADVLRSCSLRDPPCRRSRSWKKIKILSQGQILPFCIDHDDIQRGLQPLDPRVQGLWSRPYGGDPSVLKQVTR
jgi:RimJ/RimL family protein N-acetyltransferase